MTTTGIRAARKAAGLSGEALAAELGISVAWLRTIERAPALGSSELLARMAERLGLDLRAVLSGPATRRLAPLGRSPAVDSVIVSTTRKGATDGASGRR